MKNKGKKILIGYLVIIMILLSSLHSPLLVKVRADSNYSNYLSSESISVENDKALILYESSGSSNNYRNYYETGFLFPSKLRNEMYSTDLTTNPAKYYFQQTYLDNLDNEFAFLDIENLGQYETNDYIDNYTDIIETSGNYNNTDKDYEYLNPNKDISTIDYLDGYPTDYPNSYQNIDEGIDNYNWIDRNMFFDALSRRFGYYGFSNTSMNTIIQNITIIIVIFNNEAFDLNYDISVDLYSDLTSFDNKIISNFTAGLSNWFYLNYTNVNMTSIDINSLSIRLDCIDLCNYALAISLISIQLLPLILNTLQKSDNNYYNYLTEGEGNTGLFPAEHTFTDETIGNPPSSPWIIGGASHTIIANLDGHDEVLQCNDITGTTKTAELPIASSLTGTIEYWMRVSDDSKRMYWQLSDSANNGMILCTIAGDLKYFNGVAWILICAIDNNQWYHHRVIWDSNTDTFDLYIGLIQEGNDLSYNSAIGGITKFRQISYSDSNYYAWTDAVDLYTSDGYYLNRNYDDANFQLNVSSQLQIELEGNDFDNLDSLELEYTVKANNTGNLDLYLYNINSEIYDLVDTKVITTSFQEFNYSFALNYTYYSTLGLTNFTFYYESSNELLFSFDKINLNAIFSNFSLNNDGYHNINISFNRQTSGSTNRGNISLELQLYQTYFTYDYIENNVIENDYSKMNQIVNFSNELSEPLIECEIQAHIRFGLNTLDIDIVNVYYLIIFNYNYTYEIFEQLRFGNNDGNYFRYEFSYDSMNFNRLNNTGIFGNYSMNCLSGLRVLRGTTAINYNRYFLIPYFDEKISLSYTLGTAQSGAGSEPRQPTGTYWTYETFRLSEYSTVQIQVENWTIDYETVYAEKYEAKFYYKSDSVKRRDLGDWRFKIGEIKVSFNFIRNALTDIINLIFVFFQYLFFLVTASLSYIFMFLGINILVLIWNYLIYYIFIGLIWILWYIYSGLVLLALWLWDMLVVIYETYLIPFGIWLEEVLLPIILEWMIKFVAFGITCVIYFLTLGQIDFDATYIIVYDVLWLIVNELLAFIDVFLRNLYYVFLFMLLYIYNLLILYFTFLYCRARGYKKKAEKIYYTLMFYLTPVLFISDMLRKLYGLSPYP